MGPELTILVGPNNEGKSNLLKAFSLGLSVLLSDRDGMYRVRSQYRWEDDFPLDLQETQPKSSSEIEFEFELDDKEKTTFKGLTGSAWDSTLKIKISFSTNPRHTLEIKTKGRAKKVVNEKKEAILDFLFKHLSFPSLPAVRTVELTRRLTSRLLVQDLEASKKTTEYADLKKKIEALEAAPLKSLSEKTKKYLTDFSIYCNSVDIKRPRERYLMSSDSMEMFIDDGVSTSLEAKGDGIQSLVAIALMVLTSEIKAKGKSQFCSIEEPESHLHPKAVHEVGRSLKKISKGIQTIVSTHSPLIVDRENIGNNIIVRNGKAYSATSISELREVLGIQKSDNLENTRLVLLCEGDSDKLVLTSWLSAISPVISQALGKGVLEIIAIHGINKLGYQLNLYRSILCACHVFSDYDNAAKTQIANELAKKRIEQHEYNFSSAPGFKEAELEDLIDLDVYKTMMKTYGVDVTADEFKKRNTKWTNRIEKLLTSAGKQMTPELENELKNKVAEVAAKAGLSSLKQDCKPLIDGLKTALEARIVKS